MGIKPTAPCKDCPDRTVKCHSTCERYLTFRKNLDKWNNEYKKKRSLDFNECLYAASIRKKKRRMR